MSNAKILGAALALAATLAPAWADEVPVQRGAVAFEAVTPTVFNGDVRDLPAPPAWHPGDPIHLPQHLRSYEVDYECELAVVIGRAGKNIPRAKALEHVLGYTCANDVSARDHQIKLGGGQWCRGKFFDTFSPLGPRLVTADEIPDPNALAISTTLNGQRVQDSHTSDMIFDVPAIIEYLSGSTTLPAGTVILTGTPQGVGMAAKPHPRWLQPCDSVTIEIEKIGALTNPVALEGRTG